MNIFEIDVLITGTGVAGLFAALKLASRNLKVLLVTKDNIEISNSANAQGGIASVIDRSKDSFDKHIEDTLNAGAGLCNEKSVEFFVENGPEVIKELESYGVNFTKRLNGDLDLGKEGGHTERRVVHAGDITGAQLVKALKDAVLENSMITLWEYHMTIDLITTSKFALSKENRVVGAYILSPDGIVKSVAFKACLLASGGCGKVYLYTSNPDVASGDGDAIGFRAGVPLVNMEMMQFHPTIFYNERIRSFLISEALRGEGGILKTVDGKSFMEKYSEMKSLAPRDIVARAIDHELKKRGDDHVLLDMTHLDKEFIVKRFPNIFKRCLEGGIDMRKDPIPVVPAAHYMCGGLQSTVKGETIVPGLYVAGETAHTGLHGANRLASNSLLEASVMAKFAAIEIDSYISSGISICEIPRWNEKGVTDSEENVIVTQNWDEIRRFMWNYVGIVRSDKRLARALKRISLIKHEINEYYWNFKVSRNLLELRNITLVAETIIRSAMKRKESRGLHYNTDHPELLPKAKDTILLPEEIL